MTQNSVQQFWQWFLSTSSEIEACLQAGDADKASWQMSDRIGLFFPELGWEIGPGTDKQLFLAFTLNGDPENIAKAEEIIAAAPGIENWEFRVGRPRREFDGQLRFVHERGQQIEIDLDRWRYTLTAFDGGRFFDIEIATPGMRKADRRAKQQIAYTASKLCWANLTRLPISTGYHLRNILTRIGKNARRRFCI